MSVTKKKRSQETTAIVFEEKGRQIVHKVDNLLFRKLNIHGIFFASKVSEND